MSKLNICIIIICLLLFIIVYLLCNNKLENIFKINNKKLSGGEVNKDIKNINEKIKKEQQEINIISNELDSMKRNTIENTEKNENTFGEVRKRPGKDDIELNQQENNTFIMRLMDEEINNKKKNKNKREILDPVENRNMLDNEEEYNNEEEEEEEEDEEIIEEEENIKNKPIKAWENMCEGDDVKTKKKSEYEDLKLNLNGSSYLEPFNNDDFSEFGKFNC